MTLREFELTNKISEKEVVTESPKLTMYKVEIDDQISWIITYLDTIIYNKSDRVDMYALFNCFHIMEIESDLFHEKRMLRTLNDLKTDIDNIKGRVKKL